MAMSKSQSPRVAVIGAGFGGIATGVKLRQAGIETFTIFERGDGVGGVWRENVYPGAEVDIPSHWYSFSFKQYDWSRTHVGQAELQGYIDEAVDDHGLRSHIRFNTTVTRVVWDEASHSHEVTLGNGETEKFDVVVSAVGLFNVPRYPDWPGLDQFRGPVIHTARWQSGHDLSDKRVALVGTGSSGAQVATALAPDITHLTIFQRDPGWITPKGERDFTPEERARFREPKVYRRQRRQHWWMEQKRFWGGKQLQAGTKQNQLAMAQGEAYIQTALKDRPDIQKAVTPNHPFFGKRPVRATGFYETLLRENVTFVPSAVSRVTESAIVDEDGFEHEVDVIVLATGFRAAEYLAEIDLIGTGGVSVHDRWAGEPDAFLGITVPQFPNFYMLYGPGTNGGEIVSMLEAQAKYAVRAVKRMQRTGVTAIEVRPSFEARWYAWLQSKIEGTSWTMSNNYFKAPTGKVVTQWPYGNLFYRLLTKALGRISEVTR